MTTLIPKFDLMNGGTTPLGAINRTIQSKLSDSISVKDFGAIGDGITDDTVAIQAALNGVSNNQSVFFPYGVYLLSNTVNLTNKTNVILYGSGQLKITSNINALNINGCTDVNVDGLSFLGPINNQQYQLVVNGSSISSSMVSGTWSITGLGNLTPETTNYSASKTGNTVSIGLTSDAGLNITRAVTGVPISLNASDRNVFFVDDGFMNGVNTASPRFFDNTGTSYTPGQDLNANYFDYLTGVTSIRVQVGTGRFFHTATLNGLFADYNVDKLSIYKLVNEAASTNFSSFVPSSFILVQNASNNIVVNNCFFSNGYSVLSCFTGQYNIEFNNNTIKQCLSGVDVTGTSHFSASSNYFDMRFQDELGNWKDQVFFRSKAFLGNTIGKSGIFIKNNTIIGSCWGIEYINTGVVPTSSVSILNNTIYCPFAQISINVMDRISIMGNDCRSKYGFGAAIVETINSTFVAITGNVISSDIPYALTSVACGPGSCINWIFSNNFVYAPICIAAPGFSASQTIQYVEICNNVLQFSNTGIYLRNSNNIKIQSNTITQYNEGYIDGLGTNTTLSAIRVDYSYDATNFFTAINSNYMDATNCYAAFLATPSLNFGNNTINSKWTTIFFLYGGNFFDPTTALNLSFTNNTTKLSGGLPTGGNFYTATSNSSGRITISNNVDTVSAIPFTAIQTAAITGTGVVTIYDGHF